MYIFSLTQNDHYTLTIKAFSWKQISWNWTLQTVSTFKTVTDLDSYFLNLSKMTGL
jgi:hypothetical protein